MKLFKQALLVAQVMNAWDQCVNNENIKDEGQVFVDFIRMLPSECLENDNEKFSIQQLLNEIYDSLTPGVVETYLMNYWLGTVVDKDDQDQVDAAMDKMNEEIELIETFC